MRDFHELELRTLIFLALAHLRECGDNAFFNRKQITAWIYQKRDDLRQKAEEREKTGKGNNSDGIGNLLTAIRKNRKDVNSFVLREGKNEIARVDEVISCSDGHKAVEYSLGDRTVENKLSATVVFSLFQQSIAFAKIIPLKREEATVSVIYENFKTEYELENEAAIEKIIHDAIDGLYFIRKEDGHLKTTNRALIEEKDFLGHLSAPISELLKEIDAKVKSTEIRTN